MGKFFTNFLTGFLSSCSLVMPGTALPQACNSCIGPNSFRWEAESTAEMIIPAHIPCPVATRAKSTTPSGWKTNGEGMVGRMR